MLEVGYSVVKRYGLNLTTAPILTEPSLDLIVKSDEENTPSVTLASDRDQITTNPARTKTSIPHIR